MVYITEKYYRRCYFDIESFSIVETLLLKYSQLAHSIIESDKSDSEDLSFKSFDLPENLSFLRDPNADLMTLPPKEKAFVEILNAQEAEPVDKRLLNSLQFLTYNASLLGSDMHCDLVDTILVALMLLCGFVAGGSNDLFGKFSFEKFTSAKYEVRDFSEEVLIAANELAYALYQLGINRFLAFKVLELYREMAYNENLFSLISFAESCNVMITHDNKFKALMF